MEMLSEHQCEGWLEGYLLTGRHGLFNFEAFIHIVDSMFNQHAKWLKMASRSPGAAPASLNYLLTSTSGERTTTVSAIKARGSSTTHHQEGDLIRVYLPPDANCLLSVADHCLRGRGYVNLVMTDKQPELHWLTMEAAIDHCARGIGDLGGASKVGGARRDDRVLRRRPDAGVLAAVRVLREQLPGIRVRVVNVVDLMRLLPPRAPARDDRRRFVGLFTADGPLSSRSTATRRWFTASPTARASARASTCAGTRRRGRRRRRSTWSS